MKYFSYGSNMSESNLKNRGVIFSNKQKGILRGYQFIINKKSYKDPTIGFANIIPNINSFVEGVLYDVDPSEITKLDIFEGFPKHYNKISVYVNVDGFFEESIVYIAQKEWTSPIELKTTEEYKNKILEGKENLSEKYFDFLNENIKIKNSNVN
jgi:gamma-glutamylcyclotransferase